MATFAGGKPYLSANVGELSNVIGEDAYVGLPNGIVSTLATKGSFEIWAATNSERFQASQLLMEVTQQKPLSLELLG